MHWQKLSRARLHIGFGFCEKADSTLRSSQAVPHPSTDRALRCLTSEVKRDPVHSTRYGRRRRLWHRDRSLQLLEPRNGKHRDRWGGFCPSTGIILPPFWEHRPKAADLHPMGLCHPTHVVRISSVPGSSLRCGTRDGHVAHSLAPCRGNMRGALGKPGKQHPLIIKIGWHSKSPAGGASAVTRMRADTTFDHGQRAEQA